MKSYHLKKLVISAIFASLICVTTVALPIPLPGSGYANLGDTFIALAAFFVGPVWGFFAAGLGSALSDIILGYSVYAPATFIIKGAMAVVYILVFRPFAKTKIRIPMSALSALSAEALMVLGYFAYEALIYSPASALPNVTGNLMQGLCGTVISTVAVAILSHNRFIIKNSCLSERTNDK